MMKKHHFFGGIFVNCLLGMILLEATEAPVGAEKGAEVGRGHSHDTSETQLVCVAADSQVNTMSIFSDDFVDGNRDGWFEIDNDSSHYPWSLNILDAKVLDTKHWNRGIGTVEIAITDAGRGLLRTDEQHLPIHYAQCPLFAPGNRPDIDDYETIATFKTEMAKNGASEGVMIGTTAIAKGQFGCGNVVCFSPHPEMTQGLEKQVQFAIDHVRRDRSQNQTP